jgi:hypothetical protein
MTHAAVFASRIYPFLHCHHRIIQFKSEPKERIGRISIFEQPFGSEGTIENSPAFQCRDKL